MTRAWALATVLAAVLAASGCGAAPPQPEGAGPSAPAIDPDGFDPATFDPDRPCTLLRPRDAEHVENQPFFRTLAADRVEGDRVRCAHGVGDGGLQALVQAEFISPPDGGSAELLYVAMCRAPPAVRRATPLPGEPGALPQTGAGPEVPGRACALADGGYAILMADRVLVATVRSGGGAIDPAGTQRLAALLSRRVGAIG